MSRSPSALIRRFYKDAAPRPQTEGFAIALDGRAAKTPAGAVLTAPSEAVARLICQEWQTQGETIDFPAMPATRLAFTAIDRVSQARQAVAAEVARFADNDLLCYFAEYPDGLVERQERMWGPWLIWASEALDVDLVRAKGLTAPGQAARALLRAETLALELDNFGLSGLASAAGLFGSAILAFALQRGVLPADAAFDLSRLDEAFQEERWGVDAEAAIRTDGLRRDARGLEAWFEAL